MIKQPLKASGLLPSEVEVLIAEALKTDGILVDPVVTVTIVEYNSRPINVVGAVKRPVTFQATGNVTLLEAIARADGLAENAGPSILISRGDESNPLQKNLVARMDVRDLIDKAKPELNIPLYGGEEIRVPEAKKIFVAGNVKKPGGILVKEGKPITVLQALAMSEGLTPFYKKTIFILRPNEDGPKREIPIELKKVLDRKSEDVELQAEDILYVPDNNTKRVAVSILDKAASFSLATISGVLIWRQR
jgi:polysaccharide export outer membrane protein